MLSVQGFTRYAGQAGLCPCLTALQGQAEGLPVVPRASAQIDVDSDVASVEVHMPLRRLETRTV